MDLTGQTVVNETDITGLTCDSRQVEPGFLFVALPGARLDGRDYIPDALGRGAVAVLAPPGTAIEPETRPSGEAPVPVFTAANPRRRRRAR